jgi:hypothetical protein
MESVKSNRNRWAQLGGKTFCWFLARSINFLTGRISPRAACHSVDPAHPANKSMSSLLVAVEPLRHLCGRVDCPVSIDAAGNMWCWCRTVDIRDICD